ncbi:hypothetical protein AAC387_Pa02g1494 [Persea americana]
MEQFPSKASHRRLEEAVPGKLIPRTRGASGSDGLPGTSKGETDGVGARPDQHIRLSSQGEGGQERGGEGDHLLRKREAQKPLAIREDIVDRAHPGEVDLRKDLHQGKGAMPFVIP